MHVVCVIVTVNYYCFSVFIDDTVPTSPAPGNYLGYFTVHGIVNAHVHTVR